MLSLSTVFGSADQLLQQPTRKLGGYILQLINADGSRRDHPKNIRLHVVDAYAGPLAKKAAEHVLAALDFLKRERYIYNDYQDAVDSDWFALTDKGLAIREASQIEEPANRLDSDRGIVFISCGQYTEAERAIGRNLATLVEQFTDYGGYFAQNQQSLDGLSNNILKALNRASGMVVVMHKRGLVEGPSGEKFYRGSVWVEQETAIAAFLQSLDRKIPVAAYIEDGIKREGLRDLLHLNPLSFNDEQEILEDFEKKLRSGAFAPSPVAESIGTTLQSRPILGVEARIIGPDESEQLHVYPVSNSYRLLLRINNAGTGPAKNVHVDLNGTVHSLEPISSGGEILKPYNIPGYSLGSPSEDSTPKVIQVTYDGETTTNGRVVLVRIASSQPPEWGVAERQDPT